MCGIAGMIDFQKNYYEKFDVRDILDYQKHRGPDSRGTFQDEHVHIGMDRLSIIDLETGQQPFFSKDKNIVVVFNGEIYNYRELKAALIQEGFEFCTNSDTEVILQLYLKKGIDFVHDLNGMFAIFIYDKTKQESYLVRDRLGIKPLFYAQKKNALFFASELYALSQLSCLNKKLDFGSVYLFLKYSFIHQPHTIFKDFCKLEAGHYLKITPSKVSKVKYWEIPCYEKEEKVKSQDLAAEKLDFLLESSIKYRLISDVPLTAFLSGGLDSSSIVWYASAQSNKPLSVVTIGYDDDPHNDRHYAKVLGNQLNINHHLINGDRSALRYFDDIPRIMGEPFGDVTLFSTMELSEKVKSFGKVVLTGEGSDELFGGYHKYRSLFIYKMALEKLLFLKKIKNNITRYMQLSDVMKISFHESYLPVDISLKQLGFSKKIFNEIQEKREEYDPLLRDKKIAQHSNLLDMMQYYDLKYRLPEKMLSRTDRATMLSAVEARVPFLDHRIVEHVRKMDVGLRNTLFDSKKILKKVMKKRLPESILKRRKFGMPMPFDALKREPDTKSLKRSCLKKILNEKEFFAAIDRSRLKTNRFSSINTHCEILNPYLKQYMD